MWQKNILLFGKRLNHLYVHSEGYSYQITDAKSKYSHSHTQQGENQCEAQSDKEIGSQQERQD